MHKYIEQNEDLIEHFAPLEVKHLLNELNCSIIISEIKKDEHILIEGSSCDTLTYIIKGSFRQYTEAKGAEINFLFYFENDFVLDYLSFLKATPSKYSILAIENSVVLQINRTDLDSLKEKNVLWNIFLKNVAEKSIIRLYKRNEVLLTLTPEERYLKLLEVHPQIIQRVSLRKIATFIGVTEQSLSRIRKRIVS
ncbi:Crp/Fnr family transcriptional regulator [uncultured Winogradskyella sp.]|uniref:Crp/Fnr family transcriptional regulator n=1 Tax=uncultured Winogradskyella sp. TaxID=395353 RepID=UPI0030EEFDC1|tara:strand:+ start:366 stop:950 length:585 start_codon:yes stop_codon:yes gene_type:complete